MCFWLEKVLFKVVFVFVLVSELVLVGCHNHHGHHHRKRHRIHRHQVQNKPSCSDQVWNINCPSIFPDEGGTSSSPPCSWPCSGEHGTGNGVPICGSDGILYDSICLLEKEACLLREKQGQEFRGEEGGLEKVFLEVDESGRKCDHFLEPLNQNRDRGQRNQSRDGGKGESGNGESDSTTTTSPTTTQSVTNPVQNGDGGGSGSDLMKEEMMQHDQGGKEEEKVCDKEDFEVFKGKLFDLTETKWQEFISTGKRMEGRMNTKMTPKWRQLLADGPEADKDHLIQLIFSSLDLDSNFILNYSELYQGDFNLGPITPLLTFSTTTTCQWRDFLRFQDTDQDDKIHVTEFYAAFSHLYGVTMISLEKALEWKRLDAIQGSDVEIFCNVLGSPPTPVVWTTPTNMEGDPHVLHEVDGSLLILGVRLQHGGNYSCKSVRNEEVVQIISLNVRKLEDSYGGGDFNSGGENNGYENVEQFTDGNQEEEETS